MEFRTSTEGIECGAIDFWTVRPRFVIIADLSIGAHALRRGYPGRPNR
jgi:hypothetical protein